MSKIGRVRQGHIKSKRRAAKIAKDPYEGLPHPCDRRDIRACVGALAALEQKRRDKEIRSGEYRVWHRVFSIGLIKMLRGGLDDWFPVEKPSPYRRRHRRARRNES
jgi:hypothetical protein